MRVEVVARLADGGDADEDAEQGSRSELRVIFPSTPLAVRDALKSTLGGLRHLRLTDDEASTVELVLAEVMNNIVEHAYHGYLEGIVELQVTHDAEGLRCVVFDDGFPMPDGNPPTGRAPEPDPPIPQAPEGGFGWFLIRELARDLHYSREGARNRLSFRLPVARQMRTN